MGVAAKLRREKFSFECAVNERRFEYLNLFPSPNVYMYIYNIYKYMHMHNVFMRGVYMYRCMYMHNVYMTSVQCIDYNINHSLFNIKCLLNHVILFIALIDCIIIELIRSKFIEPYVAKIYFLLPQYNHNYMCTYIVYCLLTFIVYLHCVLTLCTYTVYLHCVLTLCTYTVYLHCVLTLCTYISLSLNTSILVGILSITIRNSIYTRIRDIL